MKNTRLWQLLQTLSPEERQGLKKFAESPFFNQRPEASRLLDVLLLSLKKGRATPGKEQVFQQVFDGRPFEDHRLRMAISFAYQLVRRYLTVQDFLEDEVQLAIRESEVLRRRKLYALSRHCLDSARNALDGQTVRNADFFDQEYRLLLEECRLEMTRPSAQPEQLQALSEQLDKAFLSRKLWQNCVLLSHQNMAKSDFSPGLLDQVLDNLDEPAVPAIAIYYRYYRALTQSENSAEHYQHFKAMLFEHGDIFSEEELRDLYLLAINFCIKQYNAGNQAFLREQLELYQRGLEHRYFLVAGELSAYTYLNVVTLALVVQELDWAGQFIGAYRTLLAPERQESFFSFNKARLEYAQRRLGNALQLLQKAEYKEVLLGLAAKTLQLKIYYELGEFDLLDAHLQSLKTYLYRKKVMGYHRENYINTIRFTLKLLEIKPYDQAAKTALRQVIEQTGAVAEKEWLLAQL
ncbi:MAG: hypothetical protein KAX50_09140 [Saprospiraceae bacterium]|nr:hypothetical protein [Saprospiraceae bacterium]